MNDLSTKDLFKLLAPFLALTAVSAVLVVLLMFRFLPVAHGSASVVTFDVIKYTNAQRAVASTFLKRDGDIGQANELLTNLPQRTREVIESVAGPGVLVVLKQAVVQGQGDDITDTVLKKLGLPTNVPTADGTKVAIDIAPTMLLAPLEQAKRDAPAVNKNSEQVLP